MVSPAPLTLRIVDLTLFGRPLSYVEGLRVTVGRDAAEGGASRTMTG